MKFAILVYSNGMGNKRTDCIPCKDESDVRFQSLELTRKGIYNEKVIDGNLVCD